MIKPQPSGGFAWTQEPWGPALRCVPLETAAPHLFTIANLRLVDDDQEWDAVAERMGVTAVRLIRQVHGVDVSIARSCGTDPARPEADIIISEDPRVAIGVRVADCAPVLLADPRRRAVAAVHAGWRGTLRNVAAAAVKAMTDSFASDPRDLRAAIGPCLGRCCGEMGPEVLAAFRDAGHGTCDLDRWFTRGNSGRSHFDLWGANRDQLRSAGVPGSRIHVAELCTRTYASLLHSYRAQGPNAGRMVGVIRAR